MIQLSSSILWAINLVLLLVGVYALATPTLSGFSRGFKIGIAILLTLSTISYSYYLMLVLYGNTFELLVVLSIINAVHLRWSHPIIKKVITFPVKQLYHTNTTILCAAALLSSIFFLLHGSKYGGADAWAIWNTHAKFLYDSEHWKNLLADNPVNSHSDYPLMLPSIIAFFWTAIHSTSFIVPLLFAFFQIIAIPLLVYYALSPNKIYPMIAWIAVLLFTADSGFQMLGTTQCADGLLSIFILATIVLNSSKQPGSNNMPYLLGFICASAMWIKNEGILFFIVFSLFFAVTQYREKRNVLKYFAGAMLPIVVVVSFKLCYAPSNDLVAANQHHSSAILHNLVDFHRYAVIGDFFIKCLINNFWFVIIMILFGFLFRKKLRLPSSFIVIVLILAGYFFVYLNTPYDLMWHLSTSLDRLLYHVYPAFIYLSLYSVNRALSSENAITL